MKIKLLPLFLIIVLLGCSKEDISEERRMEIITSETYNPGETYERRFECFEVLIPQGVNKVIRIYYIESECGQWRLILHEIIKPMDIPPENLVKDMNEYNEAHPNDKIQKHLIADFKFTLPEAESYHAIDFERTSEWRIVMGEYIPYESPDDGSILNYLWIVE